MKRILITVLLLGLTVVVASELKVVADTFLADDQKKYSIFKGNVRITMNTDEFNASKVTIYVDQNHRPVNVVADGNVSFSITTETHDVYLGKSQKAHFKPQEKIYKFYNDVTLRQLNHAKEINGDEVVVNVATGRAFAKGGEKKPVIMIFDINDTNQSYD